MKTTSDPTKPRAGSCTPGAPITSAGAAVHANILLSSKRPAPHHCDGVQPADADVCAADVADEALLSQAPLQPPSKEPACLAPRHHARQHALGKPATGRVTAAGTSGRGPQHSAVASRQRHQFGAPVNEPESN